MHLQKYWGSSASKMALDLEITSYQKVAEGRESWIPRLVHFHWLPKYKDDCA